MAQVIAGLYEIEKQIGKGGGGIVYLGRHMRLDKQIVLKADKRSLDTDKEALKREVELLKGLSHTYIPQVYDYVEEGGIAYTIMDFIPGESLDKMLGRGARPSQAQLIGWAYELLNALIYLHSAGPHGILHGDIKPANIMLRPNGDICLIDFNIALMLGEKGAVKVGFSRGYASPEHYGADYISSNRQAAVGQLSGTGLDTDKGGTEAEDPGRTERGDEELTETEDPGRTESGDEELTETEDPGRTERGDEEFTETEDPGRTERGDEELTETEDPGQTERGDCGSTAAAKVLGSSAGSSSGRKGGLLLDVRSDIYSLGATLYHLLSGVRPAQDAREVEPLEPPVCSPAVSRILQKAMAPEPSMRYQTAEEMLKDFLRLHRQDERAVRHRRRMAVSAAVLVTVFFAGGITAFAGQRQMSRIQETFALAEYSANSLAEGDVAGAVAQALEAVHKDEGLLNSPASAPARLALTNALAVYDLSAGFKASKLIGLPAAPFDLVISPEGTRFAAVYAWEVSVFDSGTGEKAVSLPIYRSALSDCCFLDESRIVYAGEEGVTAYDLDSGKTLWTGQPATSLALSADGSRVAAVMGDEDKCRIYRTEDGALETERSFEGRHLPVAYNDIFADPKNYCLALNRDGSMLAVSFAGGDLFIYDLMVPEGDLILYEQSEYDRFAGGFCGGYFAYTAQKSGEAVFGLVDVGEAAYLGGMASEQEFLIQAGEGGIRIANGSVLVELGLGTEITQRELAFTGNVSITAFAAEETGEASHRYVLAATDDGCFSFYDGGANLSSREIGDENCDFAVLEGGYAVVGNRNEPALRLFALEDRSGSALFSYDPRYPHDEARLSGDGERVMLFGYQGFRVMDMEGKILADVELPEAERIYDQQFHKASEGSWLEVIWYDGTMRRYSAWDGSLIAEEQGKPPEKELYEEFYTERYRIASSLHGAPEAYDRKTGRKAATLEPDSYLTYVTEVSGYIITEYISVAGERYGVLLNERLEKLAVLPGLCDVDGEWLIFDYAEGELRQCRIYSLEELVEMGEGR